MEGSGLARSLGKKAARSTTLLQHPSVGAREVWPDGWGFELASRRWSNGREDVRRLKKYIDGTFKGGGAGGFRWEEMEARGEKSNLRFLGASWLEKVREREEKKKLVFSRARVRGFQDQWRRKGRGGAAKDGRLTREGMRGERKEKEEDGRPFFSADWWSISKWGCSKDGGRRGERTRRRKRFGWAWSDPKN